MYLTSKLVTLFFSKNSFGVDHSEKPQFCPKSMTARSCVPVFYEIFCFFEFWFYRSGPECVFFVIQGFPLQIQGIGDLKRIIMPEEKQTI